MSIPYSSFGAPLSDGNLSGYAKVIFVGNATGYNTSPDGATYETPMASLGGAAGAMRVGMLDPADRGTLIVVRRGHAENISSADYFSLQGARKRIHILGEGDIVDRPTLTWTIAGSQWAMDTDSNVLENFNLNMDPGTGTTTVAAPLLISGAGCVLRKCKIRTSTDANSLTTIPVTTTAAADDLIIEDTQMYGATAGVQTTGYQFVGADRLTFRRNRVSIATSVAVGVVRFLTTASTDILMQDCILRNNFAASETVLTGMAGVTGEIDRVQLGCKANAAAQLVLNGANSSVLLMATVGFGPFISVNNDIGATGERAALMTPIAA